MTEPVDEVRAWRTEHGVTLQFPTPGRPYYRIIYYTPEGQRRMPSAGKDRDQAWAKACEIDAQLMASVADPTGRLVTELISAWLDGMKPEWSEHHWTRTKYVTNRFIVPALGHLPAWPLTRDQVKACAEKPTAKSMKRHLRNALGAMLTWGHSEEWVAEPAEYFFPRKPRTSKRDKGRQHGESIQFIPPKMRPSPEACKALAEALRDVAAKKRTKAALRRAEEMWLMVAAAASCGLREGELWAALVTSLNGVDGTWLIDRQVVRVTGKGAVVTDPKWGRTRTTTLPELTIWGESLREPLLELAATRPAGGLLFPAARGGFLHPSNFARDYLNEAREKAGPLWSPEWTWHSLRHAFCTELLNRGARDTDVALVAGHRDSGVTRAMYVGATAGATDRLNSLMRPQVEGEQAAA